MKPSCDNCIKESYCPMRTGEMSCTGFQPKRENICLKCEHFSYCSTAIHCDDGRAGMIGCSRFKEKHKQTNADRIRAMTDEELARLANKIETESRAYGIKGRAAWLEWLQKECE